MKNILITGANGFIGKHIVRKLSANSDYKLYVITRSGFKADIDNVIAIDGDLKDPATYSKIDEQIDICIHTAGYVTAGYGVEEEEKCIAENIVATLQLVKYLSVSNADAHLVYLSTCSVYNLVLDSHIDESYLHIAEDSYGLSKYYSEKMVQKHIKASSILRLAAILDSGEESAKYQKLFFEWIEKAKGNEGITIFGDGSSLRNYLFIDDLIAGIVEVLENNILGVYNVAGSENMSTADLANTIVETCNSDTKVVFDRDRQVTNSMGKLRIDKLLKVSAWQPKYDIKSIIEKALNKYNER